MSMINEAAATKTVSLKILNIPADYEKYVTVTGLPMNASLLTVMQQAQKDGKLT